jgi:uncharacterized protein YhaN
MIYEKCRDILLRECDFLQEATVLHEKIRLAVINREWEDFEALVGSMNDIENRLSDLENEREQLFTVYEAVLRKSYFSDTVDTRGRFYAFVSLLPEKQRNELTGIYRSLKFQALRLRMANDTFMSYLSGVNATIKEFFTLAFPDRAGKMYTQRGKHFSHDMRSMVLNQSF